MSKDTGQQMELGQRVRFTHVLERQEVSVVYQQEAPDYGIPQRSRWELHWLPVESAGEGVFFGYRTKPNGWTHYDYEEGHEWNQTGHVRCALVVTSPYRNPVSVPLDALTVEG